MTRELNFPGNFAFLGSLLTLVPQPRPGCDDIFVSDKVLEVSRSRLQLLLPHSCAFLQLVFQCSAVSHPAQRLSLHPGCTLIYPRRSCFIEVGLVWGFGSKQLQGNRNKVFKQCQGGKEKPSLLLWLQKLVNLSFLPLPHGHFSAKRLTFFPKGICPKAQLSSCCPSQ